MLRSPTVQREVSRLRAANSDTARSVRKVALSRLAVTVHDEDDSMRLAGIAVACATVEEKVGSEEETGPQRASYLSLALRLRQYGSRSTVARTPPQVVGVLVTTVP